MKKLIVTIAAIGVVAGLRFSARPRITKDLATETVVQFTTLIEQQEALPPQSQFARTYAWLGDQYQKAGQLANGKQVWQRGAAFFPDDAELQEKLAAQP